MSERNLMNEVTAAPVLEVAQAFFEACESGKGWAVCQRFCTPDATFSSQAEPLEDVRTLEQYTDWMKGLLTILPDGRYELKSFAADQERNNVVAYAVFYGTHTGEGGPVPPTGKRANADYVYVMDFHGDQIRHMTKIWHSGITLSQLGWA
jgi:predicted ester cyclase